MRGRAGARRDANQRLDRTVDARRCKALVDHTERLFPGSGHGARGGVPVKTRQLLAVLRGPAIPTPRSVTKAARIPPLKGMMLDQVRQVENFRVPGSRPFYVTPMRGRFAVALSIPATGLTMAGSLDEVCSGLAWASAGDPVAGRFRVWGMVPDAVTSVVVSGGTQDGKPAPPIRAVVQHNIWTLAVGHNARKFTLYRGSAVDRTVNLRTANPVRPCDRRAGTLPAGSPP